MILHSSRNQIFFKSSGRWKMASKLMSQLIFASILTACAHDPNHALGMKQVKEGQTEQGIENLKKASKNYPDKVDYRADYLIQKERVIESHLAQAIGHYAAGRLDDAESTYQKVLTIEPENVQAKTGLMLLARARFHKDAIDRANDALGREEFEEARLALQPVLIEDPKNAEAIKLSTQIDEARFNHRTIPISPDLGANFKKPVTMQFRDANLKMVLEALSKSSGLNILVDKDIKSDLKATIFVKDASVEDVLSLILMQNQLERKVINDKTIYIYPGTPAKLKEYQDLAIRTFQLTNVDVKAMQVLVKTVLKCNDTFINEKNNTLVIRDTPEVLDLAAKLLAAQDQDEPEVMLEVEVLEVNAVKASNLGVKLPQGATFAPIPVDKLTLNTFAHLSKNSIGVSSVAGANAVQVTINALEKETDTKLLASPRIRVKQNEKAKIHIGDKVPVFSSNVTPSTGTPVTTSSAQYIDVGLKLEVEPQIHMDGEVTIKTNLEVSDLGPQASSGSTTAYQISTRNASTVLRLADGETQVLAGLIRNYDNKSLDQIPLLGSLPVLGKLFTNRDASKEKREVILSITPHVVRNQHISDANLTTYWSGTGSMVRTKPVTVEKVDLIKIEGTGGNTAPNIPAMPLTPATISAPVAPSTSTVVSPLAPEPAPLSTSTPDQNVEVTTTPVNKPVDATPVVNPPSNTAIPASPPVVIKPATSPASVTTAAPRIATPTNTAITPAPRTAAPVDATSTSGGMGDATVPAR